MLGAARRNTGNAALTPSELFREAIIASLWPWRHSPLMEGSKSVSTDDWRLRSGPSDSFFFVCFFLKKKPLCVIASAAT